MKKVKEATVRVVYSPDDGGYYAEAYDRVTCRTVVRPTEVVNSAAQAKDDAVLLLTGLGYSVRFVIYD